MEFETRTYHLTGIEPLLGSQPANEKIRTAYIQSKAPKNTDVSDESGCLPEENAELQNLTVFLRDREDEGQPFLLNYTIKGFFKSALAAMKAELGVAMPAKKVDMLVAVEPRRIPISRNGEDVQTIDGTLERPLRAQTMRGERITVTASERIDAPWELDIRVRLMKNEGSKASKPLTFDALESCLDYGGTFVGLGQFRSGGYGQFSWERVGT